MLSYQLDTKLKCYNQSYIIIFILYITGYNKPINKDKLFLESKLVE